MGRFIAFLGFSLPFTAFGAINIQNATPAERAALQRAYDLLPPCMKKVVDDNAIPVKVCNGTNNAFHAPPGAGMPSGNPCPTQWGTGEFMQFDMTWLMNPKAAGDQEANNYCLRRDTVENSSVTATMLHEVAHAYQFHNGATVNAFLSQGFYQKFQKYQNDPAAQKIILEMQTKSAAGTLDKATFCSLQYKLWQIYKKKGLALRNPSDTHAADFDWGNQTTPLNMNQSAKEYFAMLTEMYAMNGWRFCAMLNEAEKTWWAANMASCMRQYPTPECMKNRNAFGARQPGDGSVGGEALKK